MAHPDNQYNAITCSKAILWLMVLLPATWTVAAAVNEPAKKTIRIMPVGDSITEGGKSFANYRYPLLQKLNAAGFRATFVGSRTSDSPAGPLAHEGYGGKNAEFLATVLGRSFAAHPADIVLIHAGHNHFADEKPVDKIVAATESMIVTVRKANPDVIVLLAQVIPSGKLPKYSYIPELNKALAGLAARLSNDRQPVVLVDHATGFDPAKHTVADQVHPNERGAAHMADRWFEALKPVLAKK